MKRFIFPIVFIMLFTFPIPYAVSNDNEIIDYSPYDIDRSDKSKVEQYDDKEQNKSVKNDDTGRVNGVPPRRPTSKYDATSVRTERCAIISFYLSGRGRILLESIQRNFKATFADGRTMSSYSVFVDDLSMGRIELDNTYKGSVCFGLSDYPIMKIEYEAK